MNYLPDVCEEYMNGALSKLTEVTEAEMYAMAKELAMDIHSNALAYLNLMVFDMFHPEDPDHDPLLD